VLVAAAPTPRRRVVATRSTSQYTVDDVNTHLADADDDEKRRVVEAEVRRRNRAGILDRWDYRDDTYTP
jgi:hypothetical protein